MFLGPASRCCPSMDYVTVSKEDRYIAVCIACDHVFYGVIHPRHYSKDDPKVAPTIAAHVAIRNAEDARDAAFARIDAAKAVLSGGVK